MDLTVKIGKTVFKNPIWVASGTFGSGEDFEDFIDFQKVGAIVTKTVTLKKREGNKPPRVVETASGLLNSIGLENKGIEHFKKEIYPQAKKRGTHIIVSIAGNGEKEFTSCAEALKEINPDGIELNLSCPNVKHGGTKAVLIAQDAQATGQIIRSVRKITKNLLIVKLTPNVTDITQIAKASEKARADAISLVNTFSGMAVDVDTMKPVLGNIIGGLSGPAIKPLALKIVRDAHKAVKIPIIGIGGIISGRDVAEFMLCGACAVQVGTSNLIDPDSQKRILKEFTDYLKEKRIKKAAAIVGKLKG